ncbi:N5-methyltetrahydromethanopterin:coenzyme M methyltransferase subunit D [Methanocella conradii HZ254]|uniref:Tetrahydromethanopterin S-methyltransferase subunit D n=1 Tax=Methanocella conradii (strain DSM 24694 / JCM 17849 / CGMCC 1.5162 / HZ254) TaxID=1041930 RepID=H8I4D6_METCZ|nr:tetrahydromethanopterin S-methyltransferase subunit D [Methanocella conradii]AFC99693.1 N5-methyltetrahydromethanopterin:coenzyme M methyltransferase subunit D [Methanocella conradii HZ254]MDI6896592.1 tetrahydromethanopterin S-methyltransferase subunit D [Methanocella conradii]
MDPITLAIVVIGIAIAGLLVGIGVHFVPVGGAPAAMAQATGIGTGTTMLAMSSGALGLISAGLVTQEIMSGKITYSGFSQAVQSGTLFSLSGLQANLLAIVLIVVAGIVGAMLMMVILAVMANVLYAFAIGVPLVSAKVKFDPITGDRQDLYVTRGTEGHGTPTVAVISSLIGGLLGGAGGALCYIILYGSGFSIGTAAFVAIGIFFVNSVLASYNITGTIEGFHDPKFNRVPRAIIACTIASFVLGVWAAALIFLGV